MERMRVRSRMYFGWGRVIILDTSGNLLLRETVIMVVMPPSIHSDEIMAVEPTNPVTDICMSQ